MNLKSSSIFIRFIPFYPIFSHLVTIGFQVPFSISQNSLQVPSPIASRSTHVMVQESAKQFVTFLSAGEFHYLCFLCDIVGYHLITCTDSWYNCLFGSMQ